MSAAPGHRQPGRPNESGGALAPLRLILGVVAVIVVCVLALSRCGGDAGADERNERERVDLDERERLESEIAQLREQIEQQRLLEEQQPQPQPQPPQQQQQQQRQERVVVSSECRRETSVNDHVWERMGMLTGRIVLVYSDGTTRLTAEGC